MAKKNDEIATRPTEAVEAVPDWVTENEDAGYEGGSNEDMVLPRLAICQSMSPQRKKNDPAYVEGLEEGDLFNTLTGEIYVQPLRLTAITMRKSRIKWKDPDQINSGIECLGRATDDPNNLEGIACQLNNGGACLHPGFDKASCRKFMNFPALLHKDGTLVVISMKSTGIKIGKSWYTAMRQYRRAGKGLPMFAQQFDFTTVVQPNPKGASYQYAFKRVDGFPPEEIGRAAASAYESMKLKEFRDVDATATAAAPEREAGDDEVGDEY